MVEKKKDSVLTFYYNYPLGDGLGLVGVVLSQICDRVLPKKKKKKI